MKKSRCIDAKVLEHGWIDGKVDNYRFQAKVYDEGSRFGIEGGRNSKLEVWDGQNRRNSDRILSYDRGWDKKANGEEAEDILWILVQYFKWFPTSEYWEKLSDQAPFPAKLRLKTGAVADIRISVSIDGYGTALDLPSGVRLKKLNPVTVWELKLQTEETGDIPCFTL